MYFGLMIAIFVIGYAMIALEHPLKINKSATAVLLAAVIWAVFALFGPGLKEGGLIHHLGETAEILFFLLGAMTIVEIIDKHDGFSIITDKITTTNKRKLLWIISILTFFMSAVLDNLTTSIVMCALLRKLVGDKNTRWFFAGMVILAANAGGAWSPIGDVTTIMLWIKGNITAGNLILQTFVPSLVSLLVPVAIIGFTMKGKLERPEKVESEESSSVTRKQSLIILIMGVALLLFVPVFKTITHLPPYLGILFGLGILWITTEIMHKNNPTNYSRLNVTTLMAVSCLNEAGHLALLAESLNELGNVYVINVVIGVLSSIIDNVPLVAAAMGMYPIEAIGAFAVDGAFWEGLAYCAGTGGSLLIIGSAAGVAVMGMEKIDFIWYLKKITLWALIGYLAGAGTFYLMSNFIFHAA